MSSNKCCFIYSGDACQPNRQSVACCRRRRRLQKPQKRRVISGDAICQKIQEFRRVTMMTTALSSSLCGGARPRWPRFLAMLPCMSVASHMSSELWFHLGRNIHVSRWAEYFSNKMSIEISPGRQHLWVQKGKVFWHGIGST